MAQTVKITPASGLLEFIGNTTSNKPYLQHDDNGNLTLTLQATKKFTVAGNLKVNGKVTMAQQTLTDGAAITWDFNSGANAKVTLAGARTLVISNMEAGDTGLILVKQDAAGSRTLTLPGSSSIVGGGTYTASPAANATDVLGVYYDGTTYWWTIGYNTVTPPLTSVGITGGDFVIANSPLTANGNIGLALATVNSTVGTFGSATAVPVITVNAKGLVTAVSATNISIPTNLDSLTDVTITSAATNQLLQFNGSQWVNWSPNYLTQAVTLQDTPPAGVDGKLWWETDTGKLKVYYGAASAWVDALPMPDMTLYLSTAGGAISGDLSIAQTLTVTGNILTSGNLTVSGTISASGYNNSNWNTAYGWGNHAAQGYATQTYVNTAVSNLVASAPSTLDTLNELATALGNDANFATTITTSIGTKQPQLNGTGFVKVSGTTVSYDNSTYLTTASAASTYVSLTGSYANPSWITSLAYSKITGVPAFLTSYTETDTLATVTGRGATTNTASVFGGGLYARGAQNDGDYSSAALWTESYNNTTTGIAFHINGIVGKFLEMRTDQRLYWDNEQVWHTGNLTNLNQLTNGPGYITGYTETDTLASVTGRGATTSTTLTLARVITTGLYGPGTSGNIAIWQYDSGNPGYGIVYNEGNPDTLRIDVSGQALTGTPDFLVGADYAQVNGNTVWHAGNLTNLNQLTNGPGYITTTGRAYPRRADGTNINFYWTGQSGQPSWLWGSNNGEDFYVWNPSNFSVNYASSAGSATTAGFADEAKWISFPDGPRDLSDRRPNWNNRSVAWDFVTAGTADGVGNYAGVMTFSPWDGTSGSTGDSSYQLAFINETGLNASGVPGLRLRNGIDSTWNNWYQVWHGGHFSQTNINNWNSAYGWGNHASAGYATTGYVTTQINNLIDAAPGTLDTLNELAAALGDDPNFATSFTTLIGNKVSKAGDTMTGVLTINTNVAGLILNRDAVSNYNGIYYSTANVPKWFIGMRENLGSNNHIHYSEELTRDILTLNVTNGNATVFGTITASNFSGSSSGTNTGDQTNISGNAATATNAVAASNLSLTSLGTASVNVNNGSSAVYRNENGSGGNLSYAPVLHLSGGDTMWQIQGDYYDSSTLRWRAGYNGTWYAWRDIIHSGNIGSQSVLYAATAGALTSMNISQFTNNSGYLTALPSHNHDDRYYTESESDLRFAAISHSHTFASLTSKPTTISGYGITDAITTGNIGSQSVNYATYAAYVENDSYYMRFHWSGQNGQPTWLWGGDEGENMYVYDPSNFSVNYANSAGALSSMNISQFTNNSGYITAETDTLASVTGRGASTTTALSLNGKVTFSSTVANRPQFPGGILGLDTADGNFDIWGISRDYYPSHATAANAWGLRWNGDNNDFEFVGGGTSRVILDMDGGNLTITGTISASGYNSANWNTAYGWGNHASAGYLTSLPSHNHDDRYYTESEIDSQIGNRLYQARVNSLDVNAFNGTGLYRGSTSSWSNRPPVGNNAGALLQIDTHPSDYAAQLFFDSSADRLYLRNAGGGSWGSWNTMWHSGNDGSGSSLDADLLDGFHASVAAAANSIPTRNASGYLIPESWIQLNGAYGLYSSTNGAHFYPNNGSYGSWRIEGSRNDYRGLQFATGINGDVSLMIHVNSNITGFHNASYDWQFYWTAGTLYCFKDNYGGGVQATVLDSVNYTNYAATSGHTHDDRYYTETEINNFFSAATAITGYSKSNWDAAYNKRPTAISFSGTGTKTLTLTQGDGSTLTASFSDIDTDTNTDAQTLTLNGSTLSISGGNSITLPTSGISQGTADSLYVNVSGDTMTGALRINGSTLGQELFAVDGTNGRLFTVTDDLSDSLYSVNTLAGLPVLEVFANNVVTIGKFGTNAIYVGQDGRVGFGTTDFSYTAADQTSPTNNRLYVNGSIQLLGANDAIVFGRGTATVLRDEKLAFGWGSGWFMEDATYLRVVGNKMVYSGGSARFDGNIFVGNETYYFYGDAPNAGIRTNGSFLVNGDIYFGTRGEWLSTYLNQAVRTDSSPTFNDIYANNWFRNNGSNEGLYNQVTTQHLSSQTNGYWDMSSTTSVSAIRFYTGGHVNSLRGHVYANSSNEIGFLNSAGNWGLRMDNNYNVQIYGTVSATNFSGSSSGTNTGDQTNISGNAATATALTSMNISQFTNNSGYIAAGSTVSEVAAQVNATRFRSAGDISQAAGNHALQIFADVNNDAFMAFHISNDYAVHFGLDDSTNRLYVGGWSDGTGTKYQMWDSRDFSSTNISNWNTAYGWGNHAGLYAAASHTHDDRYYTETESDSRYPLSRGALGTTTNVGDATGFGNNLASGTYTRSYVGHGGQVWVSHDTGGSTGNFALEVTYYGSMYVHTNVDSSSWVTKQIWTSDSFANNSSNWNTAYGWGNHASAGYQAASTAITTSNIGSQSVSNASTAGGLYVHNNRNNEANKIVRTDANGYIQAGWINTTSGAFSSAINKIYCSDDDYMRYQTPANFISNLGLITTSNIGSQSVNYAASAGSVAWTNVSGRPTALSQFTNDLGLGGAAVTIQDSAPAGTAGQLWWESDTGKLKVYYSSVWVDATPVPDMSLYYAKAGGSIDGDVTIRQTLTVVGNTLIQGVLTETSDISLKENILPLESSLDKLMKLNGVSFNKKTTPHVKEIGFIAQEVEEIIPDLVTETSDGIKTVAYSRVSAILVETIKEQQTQITELKEMVNILTKKINDL